MRCARILFVVTVLAASGSAPATQADEGWYGGIDLLFLSPKLNAVGFNGIFYPESPVPQSIDGSLSSELGFAQRVTVGYEGALGGGMQVRWFTFDQDALYHGVAMDSSGPVQIDGNTNFDVDAIDVDFLQRGMFCCWDWLASAGVRYARVDIHEQASNEFEWEDFTDALWFGLAGVEFEGAGPTFSVRGSRDVLWDGFSLFGGARTALLFGEAELDSIYRADGGPLVLDDEFVQVWELQAGTRMEHRFDKFDWTYGIFWEAQRWDSDSNVLGGFALHGFGVNTGFEY